MESEFRWVNTSFIFWLLAHRHTLCAASSNISRGQFSAWRIWGWWWGVDESKWWMTMGPQGFGNPCRTSGKNNPGLQCVKMRNVEVSILTSWRAVCVRLTSRCFWVGIVMTANQPQESTSKCSMARARLKVRFIFEWEVSSILTSSKCYWT